MGARKNDSERIIEILDAATNAVWSVTPGARAQYPISIRNGTSETHDVEVSIADPIDWATLAPSRLTLKPGSEATISLVLDVPRHQPAAGKHSITIDLRDFEGTCFGQLAGCVEVRPYYQLELTLSPRGPLIRRDLVEGFTLHCVLANRGNAQTDAQFMADGGPHLTFTFPTISVPIGGEVAFDIEAHWDPVVVKSYPDVVRVQAQYPQGEATADVAWDEIADSLGPFKPPLYGEEDFPKIVELRQESDKAARLAPNSSALSSQPNSPRPQEASIHPDQPLRVQILGAPDRLTLTKRHLSAWWLLPVAIAVVGFVIAGMHKNSQDVITPYVLIAAGSSHHAPAVKPVMERRASVARNAKSSPRTASANHRGPGLVSNGVYGVANQVEWDPRPGTALQAPAMAPKGTLWEGSVVHVSATNIKVYSPEANATRSFVMTGDFKNVFSADGSRTYPLSYLQPGSVVRVFYSYTFGIRHPNAIFVERTR